MNAQRMRARALPIPALLVLALALGACSAKSRIDDLCSNDADCGAGERCRDGVCQQVECQQSGDCPSGQYCVEGFCIDSQPCASDADCAEPTPVCDPDTGRCVACAPDCSGRCCGPDGCGGTCPDECAQTGQTCDQETCRCQGDCQPACTDRECGPDGCGGTCPPGCADGETCVDGRCQAGSVCQTDADCEVPEAPRCDVESGRCVECLDAADCAEGEICSGGVCAQQAVCTEDSQCEMGQICVDGACVAGCHSNRDCPDGWTCLPDQDPHGTCVECQNDGDCGPGQACSDGRCVIHCTSDAHCTPLYCDQASHQCVACTEDAHCAEGEICDQLECRTGCREDADCASGHCDQASHSCVECGDDDDCPLGSLCIGQGCVTGCSGDRDCPPDLQCDADMGPHGTCVECLSDADCAADHRCVAGMCEFYCASDDDCQPPRSACDAGVCVECTSNDHCERGTICIEQACRPGCQTDRDCPAGMVCAPELGEHGGCVDCLDDEDCPVGMSCESNRCVIAGSEMIRLPGGTFTRGSDPGEGEADEEPEQQIQVPTFYIDRTPVTNDQYRACVQAGACSPPADTAAFDQQALGQHPVTHVSWQQADGFCGWMGKNLLSEARWERAARGLADERSYPWGDGAPDCNRTNYAGCAGHTTRVGAHPAGASPEGALDMAGNVYEWVFDRYDRDYYQSAPTEDPWGPLEGDYRVIRGGAYDSPAANIRVANRGARAPDTTHPNVGFRCALRGMPIAAFSVEPEAGPFASTTFSVDAGPSTDPNHPTDALEVRWDWEADDVWDSGWTVAKTASHRYAYNGIFRIRLEVRDPDGNVDRASREVVASGDTGWDGAACETSQDCAHGFTCVLDVGTMSYLCREECLALIDPECHIQGRSCQWTWDPIGTACLPE